jgi:hypothetical protein
MIFAVYPRGISLEINESHVSAIEVSMSGQTLIVHAPGLQFPVLNGDQFLALPMFASAFVEMSPQRWIRPSAIRSIQRFGDEFIRVALADVRQPFDLFPGDETLERVYKALSRKIPSAPAFLALDVAA